MRTLAQVAPHERLAFIAEAMQRQQGLSQSGRGRMSVDCDSSCASALTAAVTPVGRRSAAPPAIAAPRPPAAPKQEPTPELSAQEQFALACHEAGHAVMHVLAGGQIVSAEVFSDGGRGRSDGMGGQCQYAPYDLATRQREYEFIAGGGVAQAVALFGRKPTDAQINHFLSLSPDGKQLRQLSIDTNVLRSPERDVLPLVLRCWPAIEQLAARIGRGPILHKHVVEAMGLSSDHGRHPFEINSIRAGLRRVPASKRAGA